MKRCVWTALVAVLLLVPMPSMAKEAPHVLPTLTFSAAFVREAKQNQQSTAAYVTIQNNRDTPEKLLGASSPVAERVELHRIMNNHGLRRMHEIDEIPLPPHTAVALKFGTYHLMLIGLKKSLTKGMMVPIELRFATIGRVSVVMPVVEIKTKKSLAKP